ncbi:Optic atrophy 3 -like protein [Echinococcus granulosus]|uniref:Optic atrophy 3 n=1 Tax=Echinococcus granulosus TaxID=6210 RepID=U6IYH2_ECHGR|nr:Putative OPA3-like protein [Echinococcus granulosus]EUB63455.1 Putative OPA3-like protein [Echinococcus granulosus]KAH9286882.1 Optic atrophy 3 -like protein [Echinococcus granulosus]CDS16088.1 Optic atrophy 3 [Echinococcus granulosus]
MVGAFPVFKLGVLAVKQISRPIANRLKQKASHNGFFRRYLCIPSGQLYHIWNTRLKLKILGLNKPKDVKKLPEESAAEVGAEILGECIMFSIGAFLIFLEYRRQSRNEAEKERKARSELVALHNAIQGLESRVAFQSEALYKLSQRLEVK